ncbi:predicted protein, partial [Arabidopsis lyrata subsp. lyrata]
IESEEDKLWKADVRETIEELAARGKRFLNLWTRKEKEIAIVTHCGFLFHTLNALQNECHPDVKKEICSFANCELHSIVIVDRMLGSDTSVTDYSGKIPKGSDLPSDAVVDESTSALHILTSFTKQMLEELRDKSKSVSEKLGLKPKDDKRPSYLGVHHPDTLMMC